MRVNLRGNNCRRWLKGEKIDSGSGSLLNLISFSSFIFTRLMAANLLVSLSSAFAFSDQTKKRDRGKPLVTASSGGKREKGRREDVRKSSTRGDSPDSKIMQETLERNKLVMKI